MVIPVKQLPRLPLLVDHYFYDYGKVREFYNGDFRDPASFKRQTEAVQSRSISREVLAEILYEQNQSYGCGPQTLGSIEKIVRDRACAVVTGQQVGLFSGPLYTIYKALTAVKLAECLQQRGLGSFVPIFWLASDDHDLAEIDHVVLLDKNNHLAEVRCPGPSPELKIPASNRFLPPEICGNLRQLEDLTLGTNFKAEIIEHLSEAYQPGRSYVDAFARWMARLFKSHGLILIDASHSRLKALGSDVFFREIAEGSPSTEQAIDTSRMLREAGYDLQIQLHEGILNIFYVERERQTIQRDRDRFRIKDKATSFTKDELLTLAGEKTFLFSPNVLLRPIYQDAILPTVAYIGGPGEIAYYSQMKRVYERFGLSMPVIYPRKTVTIVEKKVGHVLRKYDLKIPDLWHEPSKVIAEITSKQIPDSIQAALSQTRDHLERDFESLKREITAFDCTLEDSADLAKGKIDQPLKFLEKKLLQAAKKHNEIAVRQLLNAINNLFPNQHLQERAFNIVPFLIKYGYGLMDRFDRAIDIEEHDHQLVAMP